MLRISQPGDGGGGTFQAEGVTREKVSWWEGAWRSSEGDSGRHWCLRGGGAGCLRGPELEATGKFYRKERTNASKCSSPLPPLTSLRPSLPLLPQPHWPPCFSRDRTVPGHSSLEFFCSGCSVLPKHLSPGYSQGSLPLLRQPLRRYRCRHLHLQT